MKFSLFTSRNPRKMIRWCYVCIRVFFFKFLLDWDLFCGATVSDLGWLCCPWISQQGCALFSFALNDQCLVSVTNVHFVGLLLSDDSAHEFYSQGRFIVPCVLFVHSVQQSSELCLVPWTAIEPGSVSSESSMIPLCQPGTAICSPWCSIILV